MENKFIVYHEDNNGQVCHLGDANNRDDANNLVHRYIEQIQFKSYYWNAAMYREKLTIRVDYGSHTDFCYITCRDDAAFNEYVTGEKSKDPDELDEYSDNLIQSMYNKAKYIKAIEDKSSIEYDLKKYSCDVNFFITWTYLALQTLMGIANKPAFKRNYKRIMFAIKVYEELTNRTLGGKPELEDKLNERLAMPKKYFDIVGNVAKDNIYIYGIIEGTEYYVLKDDSTISQIISFDDQMFAIIKVNLNYKMMQVLRDSVTENEISDESLILN